MRILLRSLIGTFLLLVVAVGPSAATEPAQPAGGEPVVVTGTLDCSAEGAAEAAGDLNIHHWTADDARLTGDATYSGRWQLYDTPAEDGGIPAEQQAAVYDIVNEGGSWLCEETRTPEPPQAPGDRSTLVFTGQGDYEGMTAYIEVDLTQAPYAFSGLILQGDEPPYAEPQG
jgi:hypothetical protein